MRQTKKDGRKESVTDRQTDWKQERLGKGTGRRRERKKGGRGREGKGEREKEGGRDLYTGREGARYLEREREREIDR
jgi:hypothetical protein